MQLVEAFVISSLRADAAMHKKIPEARGSCLQATAWLLAMCISQSQDTSHLI